MEQRPPLKGGKNHPERDKNFNRKEKFVNQTQKCRINKILFGHDHTALQLDCVLAEDPDDVRGLVVRAIKLNYSGIVSESVRVLMALFPWETVQACIAIFTRLPDAPGVNMDGFFYLLRALFEMDKEFWIENPKLEPQMAQLIASVLLCRDAALAAVKEPDDSEASMLDSAIKRWLADDPRRMYRIAVELNSPQQVEDMLPAAQRVANSLIYGWAKAAPPLQVLSSIRPSLPR